MLDIIRKHSKSWAIKVPIVAIIIVFALFFGYSAMRNSGRSGSDKPVGTVNGRPLMASQFSYFFESNIGQMKQSLEGGEIPDFLMNMAKQNTMRQLVSREVALSEADALGIVIPDSQLASEIRSSQAAFQGGEFDPEFYTERFLPHFKSRYGLSYEDFVRDDMKIASFAGIFKGVGEKIASVKSPSDQWTFSVVELPAEDGNLASELLAPSADWKNILSKRGGFENSVGPISVAQRGRIAGGNLSADEYSEIFSLEKKNSTTGKSYTSGDKTYVIRLVEKKAGKEDDKASASDELDFFRTWMSKLLASAKVKSYLEQSEE